MKTKHILTFLAIGAVAIGAAACNGDIPGRPKARITFVVKDDFGKPIPNMVVGMSTFHHMVPGPEWGTRVTKKYEEKTDANGNATITGFALKPEFDCYVVRGETHYSIGRKRYYFSEEKNGRWEPWNPTVEIVCKPIIKPIAMFLGGGEINFPEKEKEFGFDLTKNDWVSPHGKGTQSDIILKLEEKSTYSDSSEPFDWRLKISFPNKGDGIQSWYGPHENLDLLAMPRYAPTEGYLDSLELKEGRTKEKFFEKRDDQNYFFRVRTVKNENGKIESCLYGKISGNIEINAIHGKAGSLTLDYFLNPTPLDVNMEHDYKKNLFAIEADKSKRRSVR